MEVTQAIQDSGNQTPLVADRPTIVRIYARTTAPDATSGLHLALEGFRNGQPLPGSPIILGPWTTYARQQRGNFGFTFDAALPQAWTQGDVDLLAWIDAHHAVHELNEKNNGFNQRVTFHTVPPLELMLVPIAYTEQSTGRFFAPTTEDEVSEWVLRSYPLSEVRVAWHAPFAFAGDLAQPEEWPRLLQQIRAMKLAERAPSSQVYYGLIPVGDPNDEPPSLRWGGMGYIGARESIGAANNGGTAAHEIGHNFGLPHAPCGNPGGPDPDFPYLNASIGEYGVDVWKMLIFTPEEYRDVMSYCGPRWFSDYNYIKLFRDQIRNGRRIIAAEAEHADSVILVRADLSKGQANVLPVYILSDMTVPTLLDPSTSEYRIDFVGDDGSLLASHGATVNVAEEHGHEAQHIHALLPMPAGADLAKVQLTRGGQVLAEQSLTDAQPASASALDLTAVEDTFSLTWPPGTAPALIRYRAKDSLQWQVLAIDWPDRSLDLNTRWLRGGEVEFDITFANQRPAASRIGAHTIMLPDKHPISWIRGESQVEAGQPVYLHGNAFDLEDGVLSIEQWFLNGQAAGSQPILALNDLTAGEYIITLRAIDSSGQVTESTHRLEVFNGQLMDQGR